MKALLALLMTAGVPQCMPPAAPAPAPEAPASVPADPRPDCVDDVIYIHDGDFVPCDVNPPQVMVLLIPLDQPYQLICDNSGGRITWIDAFNQEANCWNIDY